MSDFDAAIAEIQRVQASREFRRRYEELARRRGTVTLKCYSCGASVKHSALSPGDAVDLIERFYATTCESGHLRSPSTNEGMTDDWVSPRDAAGTPIQLALCAHHRTAGAG